MVISTPIKEVAKETAQSEMTRIIHSIIAEDAEPGNIYVKEIIP
jgi:hypothetical protein